MSRNPDNELYQRERDLARRLTQPVHRVMERGVLINEQRRKKKKSRVERHDGEVPYRKTRRDRKRTMIGGKAE